LDENNFASNWRAMLANACQLPCQMTDMQPRWQALLSAGEKRTGRGGSVKIKSLGWMEIEEN